MEQAFKIEIANGIEGSVIAATESRIRHVAALRGNPLGVEFRQWGSVRATIVRGQLSYYPHFNAIRGVGRGEEQAADAALAWFEANQIACSVPLSPYAVNENLLRHLSSRGLRPERAMNVLYAVFPAAGIHLDDPASSNVIVVEDSGDNRGNFIRLLTDGTPPADIEMCREVGVAEFRGWRRYVAYVNDEPAALAALWHNNKNAFFASAWTKTEFRGLGCQTELLRRRMAEAVRLGCRLVISEAVPGSQSHRNLERVGLRVAYTKSLWMHEQ